MTDSTTLPLSELAGAAAGNQPGAKPARPSRRPPQPPPIPLELLAAANAEEEPKEDEDLEQALLKAPPWLMSTVVHMSALILMGITWYTLEPKAEVQIVANDAPVSDLSNEEGGFVDGDNQPFGTPDVVNEGFKAMDLPAVANPSPLATPTLELSPNGTMQGTNVTGLKIGDGFKGRGKGMKGVLNRIGGGTSDTKKGVREALEWFKRNQRADGSWSLKGPYADPAYDENVPAATGLALLAFQGDGHTHKEGDHKAVVKKGWDALLKLQAPSGQFLGTGLPSQHQLYTHAQCTIAICELYGMTNDSVYKHPAELAIGFCVKAQDAKLGGWRYEPGLDSDLSVTGWFLMALQSARMAGLEVPTETFEKAAKFLDSVQAAEGSQYVYILNDRPSLAMTAEGLLSRQYLGWKRDDIRLITGANLIAGNLIKTTDNERDVYYWYYATQVMHHMGGDHWRQWNNEMKVQIPKAQVQDGREKGSWNPGAYRWGDQGGRLFITALQTFMLEVYYRHMPLYGDLNKKH